MPIGSVWASGSWVDASWADGSWADASEVTVVEYQYEIKPFGSVVWELLQDWTEDSSIEAPGYPEGVTGYRVRSRDAADHSDVSDWVEWEVERLAEAPADKPPLDISRSVLGVTRTSRSVLRVTRSTRSKLGV